MENKKPVTVAEAGKIGGKSKSEAKQAAARENGKKGGRPKKEIWTHEEKQKILNSYLGK